MTTDKGEVRKWTVLLGENGAGKSTILRSIALLLAGSEAFSELAGDTDSWIRNTEKKATIRAVLTTAKQEEREIALNFKRGEGLRQMFYTNKKTLDVLDRALNHTKRNYFTVGYGVSRRLPAEKSLSRDRYDDPRANQVASLFAPNAELAPFEEWAADLHYRRGKSALKLVKTALSDFLPGVEFQTIDKENRRLMFKTDDGTIPLSVLSDGFQNAISWCGDLLLRLTKIFEDYQKPLNARGLLLIDEIGLHLHLSWQRRLREYISKKFPNLQIIATTHSPFAAHQAGEGELFSLVRDSQSEIKLQRFEGAPNRLLLHQLIMTPFFGLNTMNSLKWEKIREEYRALYKKKDKSKKDKMRMAELEEILEDQPDWSADEPHFKEIKSLLEKIRHEKGDRR
jgi:AAA15 family ATPase/GTPase